MTHSPTLKNSHTSTRHLAVKLNIQEEVHMRFFTFLAALLVPLVLFAPMDEAMAQETPFISENVERNLVNELSGDLAYDNLRWLAHYHRTGGSEDFHKAALFIEQKAKEYGLEEVKLVSQKFSGRSWSATSGELWVVEPKEMKLGSYAEYAVALATNSRSTNSTAELVDVGEGTEKEYEGKDVKGKIVLTSGSPAAAMNEAVWKRGALGVVSSVYHTFPRTSTMIERPDQVAWTGIQYESEDGKPGTFGFMVSPRKGKMLQEMLKNGKVTVKVVIDAGFKDPPTQEYVEAFIIGSKVHDKQIVLTAHLQEEKTSANDDGSGCVNILDIGRTLMRLIKEGKIERPVRDIRFWWTTEISSEYQYFRDHPEDRAKMLVNINEDMVGAKQSLGSRVQHITRTPYSIPSYLSDVVENLVNYVVNGNTMFLATALSGKPQPFTKPILSHLGTREHYDARVVPYFNSTDHLVFNEGIIGIPGVTLTNMPDDYIHSTDDDLWQIDQTQLKRNAFIVAAAALYIADASDEHVPTLSSEVFSMGLKRINVDFNTSLRNLEKNRTGNVEEAYKSSRNLIHQAFIREGRAIESVRVFANPSGGKLAYLSSLQEDLAALEDSYYKRLDRYYELITGHSKTPSLKLSTKEEELAKKIPANILDVSAYFEKRGKVRGVSGIHPEMRYEVFNLVNGKNSYLDIYNAVSAEAISAGEFYYGTVKLDKVEELLNKAVEVGALTMK